MGIKLVPFKPWHINLIAATPLLKYQARQFTELAIPAGSILKTVYYGTRPMCIASMLPLEEGWEVGIFVDERAKKTPLALFKTTKHLFKVVETLAENKPVFAYTLATSEVRASFARHLGLEYRKTLENYYGFDADALVWEYCYDRN